MKTRIVATSYHAGCFYALYSDGSLQRRPLGGVWELVTAPMCDWPEVA